MGGAVSSAIARALGAGDQVRAKELAAHAVALAVLLAAATTCVMLALGPLLYRLMGGSGEMLAAAVRYSTVVFSGAIAIYLLNILASVVRGTGDMTRPALALAAGIAGHVLLSPLLIFGLGPFPRMGIAGAALGLVVSFGIAASYLFLYLRGAASPLVPVFAGARWRWTHFREFLRVGVPGMVNVAMNNMSIAILTGVTAYLGRDAQLGYALGARLEYIVIPLAFVFGSALVAMVGTNWGAGKRARARAIAWTGGMLAGGACGAVGLAASIFPQAWMRLYATEPAVVEAGALYLRIAGPCYALFGFGQALYFASQGFGNPLPAVLANVARLALSAVGAWIAVVAFGAGALVVFAGIAAGFALYAALNAMLLERAAPGA
jgi:putative MATE family efflux protein